MCEGYRFKSRISEAESMERSKDIEEVMANRGGHRQSARGQ